MVPEVIFPNLGIEIAHLPRVAFSLFGLEVYFYGLCIGLAIASGTLYAVHEAKRTGQNPDHYLNFLFYVVLACVVGARLYYVIFTWENYRDNLLKIFATREGGLAIYGAVIAAIITAIIYTRKNKMSFWLFADTAAPALILGQAIGRWGNFFNREAFGGISNGRFAMAYLKEQVPFVPDIVAEFPVMINGAAYIQVHPTFLYESLWCLFIFAVMNILKRLKRTDGEVFALYLFGYGMGRFAIEGLRTDQLLLWGTNLAVSQVVSIILVVAGFILFWNVDKFKRNGQENDGIIENKDAQTEK